MRHSVLVAALAVGIMVMLYSWRPETNPMVIAIAVVGGYTLAVVDRLVTEPR